MVIINIIITIRAEANARFGRTLERTQRRDFRYPLNRPSFSIFDASSARRRCARVPTHAVACYVLRCCARAVTSRHAH